MSSLLSQLQSFLRSIDANEASNKSPQEHQMPQQLQDDIIEYIENSFNDAAKEVDESGLTQENDSEDDTDHPLNNPTLWVILLNALTFNPKLYQFSLRNLHDMRDFWQRDFAALGRNYQLVILMFIYNVLVLHLDEDKRRDLFFGTSPRSTVKTLFEEDWFTGIYRELFLPEEDSSDDDEEVDQDINVSRELPEENPLRSCTDDFTVFSKLIMQKLLLLHISREDECARIWSTWLSKLMDQQEWKALVNVMDILELFVTEEDSKMTPALQETIAVTTLNLLKKMIEDYIAPLSSVETQPDESSPETPPVHQQKTALRFIQFECVFVMIQVIAHTTVSDFYDAHFVRQALHKADILQVMHLLLSLPNKQVKQDEGVNNEILKHTGLQVIKEQKGFNNMYYYYKSNMIRILGNMAFEDKEIATDMLHKKLIPIILNHTKIDDLNPYIREWSIVAINHLCELSKEIRDYIEKVRTVKVDPTTQSMLNKMGVEAEVVNDRLQIRKDEKK